jgi:proline racemase
MREPETVVRLDMPGGLVVATARCRAGKCESVRLENVPCFAHALDAELDVAGLGRISVDVAYGGMYYAIVDTAALGLAVRPENARTFVELADRIRVAARQQLEIVHPENPDIRDVTMIQFAEPYRGSGAVTPNTCVLAAGRSDRSPTGTGTSARMAVLHARGAMAVGDTLVHASILGTEFTGTILRETAVAGRPAIVPSIEGSAWITGFHTYLLDASDPFPAGYLVPDTTGGTGLLAES